MRTVDIWLLIAFTFVTSSYSSLLKGRELAKLHPETQIDLSNCNILADALQELHDLQSAEEISAQNVKKKKKNKKSPESRVFAFLQSTKHIKTLGFSARIQLNALLEFRQLTGYTGKKLFDEAKKYFGNSTLNVDYLKEVVPDTVYNTLYSDKDCPLAGTYKCPRRADYRTYDGSCNNDLFPNNGRTNSAFARFLPADYADDIEKPRVASDGSDLPSARAVSRLLFESRSGHVSGVHTQLTMGLGQFLDHDLSHTPISKLLDEGELVDFDCGDSGCETEGPDHTECYPIPVSPDDPVFANKDCLMFVRSQEFMLDDCEIGPREQSNSLTSWVDASHVYGSSKEEVKRLKVKDGRRGKMKTSKHPLNTRSVKYRDLLPTQVDSSCRGVTDTVKCFLAGDVRQNEQIGLTSLHTVFMRMHNVIEENLHKQRPKWKAFRLFEESRRLLGALWQNIVFSEYLPVILGPAIMDKYQLWLKKPGDRYFGYDRLGSGTIRNAFAAAAFRFGHSMIGDSLNLTNKYYNLTESLPLSTILFNPTEIYNLHFNTTTGIDAILMGQMSGSADPCDRFFSKQITIKLFANNPIRGVGTDLTALNIQRGRDHGVPGYTQWLRFCDLHIPESFDDLKYMDERSKQKLAKIYNHVNDIDLFSGGISERSMEAGIVGPTFACIIAHQFRNLRNGDKYWFENKQAKLTQDQVDSIKKFKLSKLFCETLDDVDTIQPFALLQPLAEAAAFVQARPDEMYKFSILYKGTKNKRVSCNNLPDIDYTLWSEKNWRKSLRKERATNPFSC